VRSLRAGSGHRGRDVAGPGWFAEFCRAILTERRQILHLPVVAILIRLLLLFGGVSWLAQPPVTDVYLKCMAEIFSGGE
jgi:hypothetical protein